MAFTAITSAEITVGEPTTAVTATKIKDNFDDHETRIASLETSVGVFSPISFNMKGDMAFGTSFSSTDMLYEKMEFDRTLTAIQLVVLRAPTTGSAFTVDVGYYRGGSGFASILSSNISVPSSATQFAEYTATLSVTSILADDRLALRITDGGNDMKEFQVNLEYSV